MLTTTPCVPITYPQPYCIDSTSPLPDAFQNTFWVLVIPAPVLSSPRFSAFQPSSRTDESIRLAVASEWWNSE